MSKQSIIYGYIQCAEWMSSDVHRLHRLNREIIAALPETDTFPHLTRGMFAVPGEDLQQAGSKLQIIHFGASMYEVEIEWRKWLEKFEALLKKLYWFNATVHLRAEILGDFQYDWTVDANQIARILRQNGIVDTESYRKLGRNQLRLAMYPAIEPDDLATLTRAIDFVVAELS